MFSTDNPHGSAVLVGVIGGSGVYRLFSQDEMKHYKIDTPFGPPSGDVCVATVGGVACAFLPRHGAHHTLNPSEVNYRANVYALKVLGVRYLISVSAVGSLDAAYVPGDLVLVDQIIDRTTRRNSTFFEGGVVAHVDYAHPTSGVFRRVAHDCVHELFAGVGAARGAGWRLHDAGTIVTMEGPQFSTRAESLWNKTIGGHLIGMTTATEAKLAREAEMACVVIAMVTDMDAWSDAPHVVVTSVCEVMERNVEKTRRCILRIVEAVGANPFVDPAHSCLKHALCSKPEGVTREVRERLAPILAGYPQFSPVKKGEK